jgi:hypothetical protein
MVLFEKIFKNIEKNYILKKLSYIEIIYNWDE